MVTICRYEVPDDRTGQLLFSIDLCLQTIVTAIDPVTGEKQVNPKL